MARDGSFINDYGYQASFLRYIEGNRLLTLCYNNADETAELALAKRFLCFRTCYSSSTFPGLLRLSGFDSQARQFGALQGKRLVNLVNTILI